MLLLVGKGLKDNSLLKHTFLPPSLPPSLPQVPLRVSMLKAFSTSQASQDSTQSGTQPLTQSALSLTQPSQHLTPRELSQGVEIGQSGLRREVGREISLVIGWAFRRKGGREVGREVGRKGKGGEKRGGNRRGEFPFRDTALVAPDTE